MGKLVGNKYLIGDVHLGRVFKNDVPLHRRGQRETMLREAFISELNEGVSNPEAEMVVQVGDLFDKVLVSLDVLIDTMNLIKDKALTNPEKLFVFMAGNHDISRHNEKKSCFEILSILLYNVTNVIFVINEPKELGDLLAIPFKYEPFEERISKLSGKFECIVTHEDEDVLIANQSQLKNLLTTNGRIYNGHIHLKSEHVLFENVGSVMPLAHSEDAEGNLFISLTVEELNLIDADVLKNHCVRIKLKPGEVAPDPVDCLQWKLVKGDSEEDALDDVFDAECEDLQIERRLREKLKPLGTFEKVWVLYQEKRIEGII